MSELQLDAVIPDAERGRVLRAVESLDCTVQGGWVLVGRFAIAAWAHSRGEAFRTDAQLNDIDIVAPLGALHNPDFIADWHMAHWHSKAQYAAAIHRETGVKADIFQREPYETMQPVAAHFVGREVLVIPAEEQLVHLLLDLHARTAEGAGFGSNRKIIEGIEALQKIVSTEILQSVWATIGQEDDLTTFTEQTLAAGRQQGRAQQSKFGHIVQSLAKKCAKCDPPTDIPLIHDAKAAAIMVWGSLRRQRF